MEYVYAYSECGGYYKKLHIGRHVPGQVSGWIYLGCAERGGGEGTPDALILKGLIEKIDALQADWTNNKPVWTQHVEMLLRVICGCVGGVRSELATESQFLKRVTEDEPQLIDPNPEPRIVTDGEGELVITPPVHQQNVFNFAVNGRWKPDD